MYRCLLAAIVAFGVVFQVGAQSRAFPQNTLRASIAFGDYPSVLLNGKPTTLTPGSRVRDQQNRIVSAASLTGMKPLVNYTLDMGGQQVRDVWILTPAEAAVMPWPLTL